MIRPGAKRCAIGERRKLRVNDIQQKTVAFICAETSIRGVTRIAPGGTAFFVLVPEDGVYVCYAVTARHCIEDIGDRPIYLRVNKGDRFEDIETRLEDWFIHDHADVAAARFLGEGFSNLGALTMDRFITADHTYRSSDPEMKTFSGVSEGAPRPSETVIPVEMGNDVFFVGLFVQHTGHERNLPIARFGQISRMPLEPVGIPGGRSIPAYLVETRSWGGHSGSPVWWRHPIVQFVAVDAFAEAPDGLKTADGKIWVQNPDVDVVALLGLVSGHFDIDQAARVGKDVDQTITTAINSGIAIVTPAESIRELLMREDVMDDRKQEARRANQEAAATRSVTLDSSPSPGTQEYDRFERLAHQLVQVPKSELDAKRRDES